MLINTGCSREENQVARRAVSEDVSMYILLYILNFEPFKIFKTIKLKNNYLKGKQK